MVKKGIKTNPELSPEKRIELEKVSNIAKTHATLFMSQLLMGRVSFAGVFSGIGMFVAACYEDCSLLIPDKEQEEFKKLFKDMLDNSFNLLINS